VLLPGVDFVRAEKGVAGLETTESRRIRRGEGRADVLGARRKFGESADSRDRILPVHPAANGSASPRDGHSVSTQCISGANGWGQDRLVLQI
jgi:hypothetical protein